MKHRGLLMALGVSLLFNVFVLLGFVQARAQLGQEPALRGAPPRDGAIAQRLRDDLKLNEEQAALFMELSHELRSQRASLEKEMALARHELFSELRQPAPDLERLKALVTRQSELERDMRLAGTEVFGRFMGVLDVPQRRMLFARLAAGPLGQPPPPWLRRFDANGNGVLEPPELDEARKAGEERGFGDPDRRRPGEPPRRRRDGLPPFTPPPPPENGGL
jgi:hypothetical protein